MAKNTEKNRTPANKRAREKYKKENFKYQTVCFKKHELEEINTFCKENNIAKNTLLRQAAMEAIGKPIE